MLKCRVLQGGLAREAAGLGQDLTLRFVFMKSVKKTGSYSRKAKDHSCSQSPDDTAEVLIRGAPKKV